MFSVFLELVKKVGIFVIIGQTIMHFGIGKKYEKYMKLVISFMVAAQIIFAFGIYLKQDSKVWKEITAEEYLKEWDLSIKELEMQMENSKKEKKDALNQVSPKVFEKENMWNGKIKIERVTIP